MAAELFGFEDGGITGTKRKAAGKIQRAPRGAGIAPAGIA